MDEETITITKKEHEQLMRSERKLMYLEGAGVDNWEWYDIAMKMMVEDENSD